MTHWSSSEDAVLRGLVRGHGPRWARIVLTGMLPGRSVEAVRRRWSEIRDLPALAPVLCKVGSSLPPGGGEERALPLSGGRGLVRSSSGGRPWDYFPRS